jgi:hypothetical protein
MVTLTACTARVAPAQNQAAPAAADTLRDGPHVYWQNDSTAIVFYFCDGRMESQRLQVADTLRFTGLCGDEANAHSIPARAPEVRPHMVDGVSKIFAVSDIHGEYEALVDLLRNSGIVDEDLRWSWGNGHLVIDGDVFDRGDRVTECFWLIYRLEQEAELAGGRVHMLIGNHEVMAMMGDLRYVNTKYMGGIVRRTHITYPDLFGPDMELGRWLRSKHLAIRLNDVLFVHAGIPPEAVERGLSLDDMNRIARESLDLRTYELAFSDTADFLFGGAGPTWYRGFYKASESSRYPAATSEEIEAILEVYGAETVVVGHTQTELEIEVSHAGRVIGIDVRVPELGSLQGLLWQDGAFYRVTGTGQLERLE